MIAGLVRHDQIGCSLVVELVDLVAILEDRNVPFEEIDEDTLARLEHPAERREMQRCRYGLGDCGHVSLPGG